MRVPGPEQHLTNDLQQRARDERLAHIISEMRRRIRPVCPTMPEELFFEMIERMAVLQLKYELVDKPDVIR